MSLTSMKVSWKVDVYYESVSKTKQINQLIKKYSTGDKLCSLLGVKESHTTC